MSRVSETLRAFDYAEQAFKNPWPATLPRDPPTLPRDPRLMPEDVPIDVCMLFSKLALRVAAAGFNRYSSDAILHQIRWHEQVERGNREFKANDHWTAPLARWFLANHPELPNFFTTRRLKEECNAKA